MPNFYLYPYGTTTKYRLSNVNREFTVDFEKLSKTDTMRNGNSVRDVIDVKRTFHIKWEWLPHLDEMTFDGGMGFRSLLDFYEYVDSEGGLLTFEWPDGSGGSLAATVLISENTTAELNRIYTGPKPVWVKTLMEDTSISSSTILLDSITGLAPGQVFVLGGNYYTITTVPEDDNTPAIIGISPSLVASALSGTLATEVGETENTGRSMYWNVSLELVEV